MNPYPDNIRLAALDLDRTTLRSDNSLSLTCRSAIIACLEAGIQVAVASGRAYGSLPEEVLVIPGLEYAITGNGAVVCRRGERIYARCLEAASAERILELVPEEIPLETFVDGIPYASREYAEDPAAYGAREEAVGYVRSTRKPVDDIRAFIREHREELDSLDVVIDDLRGREALRSELEENVPDVYITSSVPQLIEISHRDAGKHQGLAWLAGYLGIPLAETAAFGDAENDREMLRLAGLGVAVANASEEVREAADLVAPSNDDDGVACVLRQILKMHI